eukprot:22096-Pyramimonas_sp.AAC.1
MPGAGGGRQERRARPRRRWPPWRRGSRRQPRLARGAELQPLRAWPPGGGDGGRSPGRALQ